MNAQGDFFPEELHQESLRKASQEVQSAGVQDQPSQQHGHNWVLFDSPQDAAE